jgi:hypothetical protein
MTAWCANGRYRILEEIGSGSVATRYLAKGATADLPPWLVIERIHPHLVEEPICDMFACIAQDAAHVAHPNVMTSYEVSRTAARTGS